MTTDVLDVCTACGRKIPRTSGRVLVRGDAGTRDASVTCVFCNHCTGPGTTKRLHSLAHPKCSVPWHDVWDHSSVAQCRNAAEADIFVRAWNREDEAERYGPRTAGDLVLLGLCTGACLVADEASEKTCDCRCGGRWHGVLVGALITGREAFKGVDGVSGRAQDAAPGTTGTSTPPRTSTKRPGWSLLPPEGR